jgi:hypothetical protein
VPRSFAAAASPTLAGWLLGMSSFGWPLIVGGAIKSVYDLLLLAMFSRVHPPEEGLSPPAPPTSPGPTPRFPAPGPAQTPRGP